MKLMVLIRFFSFILFCDLCFIHLSECFSSSDDETSHNHNKNDRRNLCCSTFCENNLNSYNQTISKNELISIIQSLTQLDENCSSKTNQTGNSTQSRENIQHKPNIETKDGHNHRHRRHAEHVHEDGHERSHDEIAGEESTECAEHDLNQLFTYHGIGETLTQSQLVSICPGVLHLAFKRKQLCCSAAAGAHDHHDDEHVVEPGSRGRAWGYAMAGTLLVAVAGLGAVALIPLLQQVAFNHVLQIMVALGVGTMLGDALLHLIPHAIVAAIAPSGEVHAHAHNTEASKREHFRLAMCGLTCFAGAYIFYLLEEMVRSWHDVKRRFQKMRTNAACVPLMESGVPHCVPRCDRQSRERCKTASCSDEVAHSFHDRDVAPHTDACLSDEVMVNSDGEEVISAANEPLQMSLEVKCNGDVPSPEKPAEPVHHVLPIGGAVCENGDVAKEADEFNRFLLPMHGHSHDQANSKHAAIMVIIGDALHNVSDGLALGAAFAADVTTGVSTTIAVLFHELPHELGDFAILLNSGMSTKKAILVNCLSSCFALLGAMIGVAVGNLQSAPAWIFALIAGSFIYVSLVDMLPQMVNVRPKPGESPFFHFLLQNIGLLLGVGIMLLIALFEEDLKHILT